MEPKGRRYKPFDRAPFEILRRKALLATVQARSSPGDWTLLSPERGVGRLWLEEIINAVLISIAPYGTQQPGQASPIRVYSLGTDLLKLQDRARLWAVVDGRNAIGEKASCTRRFNNTGSYCSTAWLLTVLYTKAFVGEVPQYNVGRFSGGLGESRAQTRRLSCSRPDSWRIPYTNPN